MKMVKYSGSPFVQPGGAGLEVGSGVSGFCFKISFMPRLLP